MDVAEEKARKQKGLIPLPAVSPPRGHRAQREKNLYLGKHVYKNPNAGEDKVNT